MIHISNLQDDGYDIFTGRDVASGQFIGTLYWDSSVGDTPGWVLCFGEEGFNNFEALLPDTTNEIEAMLAERGYELDTSSRVEIERYDEWRKGTLRLTEPRYLLTHDRIAPEPCEVTERELRAMIADLHADDPDAGWNLTLEITDDAIYTVGSDWLNGREEIAQRCITRKETMSVELTRDELYLLAGAIRQQAEHLEEFSGRDNDEVRFLHDRATTLYNLG